MLVWLTLGVIVVVVSGVVYHRSKNAPLSILVGAVVPTVLLQIVTRLQLGYMDPLWPIGAVVSFAGSLAIAIAAVAVLRYRSRPGPKGT
jgi:hypothetical protein